MIKTWEPIACNCCYSGLDCNGNICCVCKGYVMYSRHIKSGALALYPGGPFIGKEPKELKIEE